jgi:lysophospholipid acyltransferase (LPLAT)-like uncharacterized protein
VIVKAVKAVAQVCVESWKRTILRLPFSSVQDLIAIGIQAMLEKSPEANKLLKLQDKLRVSVGGTAPHL